MVALCEIEKDTLAPGMRKNLKHIAAQPARRRRNKIIVELCVLFGIGAVIWLVAVDIDAYERLHEFMVAHEEFELDEVFLALIVIGMMGFIFAVQRLVDVRREVRTRHLAEARAKWVASHDPLTRLPNRRFLYQDRGRMVRRYAGQHAVAVLAVDLDGFKRINDLIGHDGGDMLLVDIARRLREAFPDDLVVRMGGDEFVVILDGAAEDDLLSLSSKLIDDLCRPIEIKGVHVEVGASVGIAQGVVGDGDLQRLVGRADLALYGAKRGGRNRAMLHEPRMDVEAEERADLERRLRRALREEAIIPHYQPLIDLNSGRLRGFEALARWAIEPGKYVRPEVFVALAEETGLILDLSMQILRRACADAKTWPAHLIVAVNMSPIMMSDRMLGERILSVLGDLDFSTDRLELELTESAVAVDPDCAATLMDALHEQGVRFALDNFGRGQSSLTLLNALTFDFVKIDRGFVSSFTTDRRCREVVRSIASLGRALGITVAAEGIERREERDALRQFGCKYGQGHFLGRAIPGEDTLRYIQDHTRSRERNHA